MTSILKRFITWFFSRPPEPLSPLRIVAWWEVRRIPYNVIVGITGIMGLALYYLFITMANGLEPGEDLVEPMALIMAPFFINICYTAGWIVELPANVIRHKGSSPIGPTLLKLGVGFSIFVTSLPAIIWFAILIVRNI